ncbi:MAG: phosphoserine transaminase [Proteobacteria bacterium]|nr:phosphoserine transaminase [Pseudomonadota bacterium]
MKPSQRPANPRFSSGPCTKRPGWTLDALKGALVGRSHRSADGKKIFKQAIQKTKEILGLPEGYQIIFTPASDTGAMETALWSMLGPRPVDVLVWESFGQGWAVDITDQLKLENVRIIEAPYGELPDLGQVNPGHDVVFTWNGTTSGVRVPDGEWISEAREGLTICDATSGIFAMDLPFEKLDVVTYSWQKVLGGEAQHGTMILSPRAIGRLESYRPTWPLPKLFRLVKDGKVNPALFEGSTINTPSMLCLEDYLDALRWAESVGGKAGLIRRTEANAAAIGAWVADTPWVDFLARERKVRSTTSVCLKIVDEWFEGLTEVERRAFVGKMVKLLEAEEAAYDIGAYRAAPPGLRIWAGATVETADLEALFPWLDWAFMNIKEEVE